MSDSPEEIFETVRKSFEEGLWLRIEIEDGRVVETRVADIDADEPLAEETHREPPHGEFRAHLLPKGVMHVQGGTIYAKEDYNGNWRPVEVYWTTGVDEHGSPVEDDGGEIASIEMFDGDE
ncbi:hypothetical protein [Haloplanus sp. C73]|uniref:hypothetical protein n=1 Tax=Haloplanus sp. C73 TaxID=3421641 RepID=UPI003EBA494E